MIQRLIAITLVPGLLATPGCVDRPEAAGAAWSTKSQSILGSPEAEPPLVVDPLVTAEPEPVTADLQRAALDVLQQALQSQDPLVRANAIEGLKDAPDRVYVEEAARMGLVDDNRGVRFVAAMTIGDLQLGEIAHLLEPLLSDPSQSVKAAALYGLRRNGHEVDLTPLARMLEEPDPEVKANAAMILGELGNATAVPLLETALGRGLSRTSPARARVVDMQIAEALVRLGQERHLEGIRAALYAPPEWGELTALACQICGRLRDGRVTSNLYDLATRTGDRQQSPEVRMASAMALAEIDPPRAPVGVPLSYASSGRIELRAQAALTLGAIGKPAAGPTLTTLLNDPSPLVQVSAAAAILRRSR